MLISSDSDDDSPDQILKRLERNKKQLRAERNSLEDNSNIGINTFNVEEDVILVSDTCDNRKPYSSNSINSFSNNASQSSTTDLTKNYESTDIFLNDHVVEIETVTSRRRKRKKAPADSEPVTRRGKRGRQGNDSVTPVTKSRRGRKGKSTTASVAPEVAFVELSRGRGRGRSQARANTNDSPISLLTPELPRGTRNRRQSKRIISSIPVYSVGNTDEYPDASDDVALFKSIPDKPAITDLDISLDNEELSVKVLWRSVEVFPFTIRRLQKISKIFDFFSEREGVPRSNLLFMYNNKVLAPDDTPDSIDYSFVKFIDGGVTSTGLSLPDVQPTKVTHGFRVKFQCQGTKKPYVIGIGNDEKLQLALIKCAEHLEVPISNLRFEFDGEIVRGNLTPKDMDIENGDCIDVKILNVNK